MGHEMMLALHDTEEMKSAIISGNMSSRLRGASDSHVDHQFGPPELGRPSLSESTGRCSSGVKLVSSSLHHNRDQIHDQILDYHRLEQNDENLFEDEVEE